MKLNLSFTLIAIVLLGFVVNANAQKRDDDRKDIVFETRTIPVDSAVFWRKDAVEGKWESNKTLFRGLQWVTFTFEGKKYYAMLHAEMSGFYRYPIIKEEWVPVDELHYACLSESQYFDLIKRLDEKSGKAFTFKTKYYGVIGNKISTEDQQAFDKKLASDITTKMLNASSWLQSLFIFNSQTLDGKNILRFLFPSESDIQTIFKTNYFEMPLDKMKQGMKF